MSEAHIPGVAAALVDSGRVVWIGTYGFANVASGERVTDSTPLQIASVSKTITATVLMTLYAAGRFRLDDDINRYLPFGVRNPKHPGAPITFRQLMIHRSSIADNPKYYEPLWRQSNGDNTTPLDAYLRNYLTPKGRDYSKENFLDVAPGDTTVYCNTCYALLGYLAQVVSGVPFAKLTDSVLFKPLGMKDTHWFVSDFPAQRPPATPYRFGADTGFVAYGQNGYPDWPAGTLRTSIRDLSRFLAMYVNGGTAGGKQVIPKRVVNTMAPHDLHMGFLTWWPFGVSTGEVLYRHSGGDNGVRTMMAFSPTKKRGVIVLTNGEAAVDQLAGEIYVRMVQSLEKPQRMTRLSRHPTSSSRD
jgi:CubicO group peptidase (beta-lactamase class C family)